VLLLAFFHFVRIPTASILNLGTLRKAGAAAPEARRSSVKEMEDHVEAITEHLADVQIDEPAEDAPAGAAEVAPADA